jgi:Ankyrin repeats (3 copies)
MLLISPNLSKKPRCMNYNKNLLNGAILQNNLDQVRALFHTQKFPPDEINEAFLLAVDRGLLELTKYLYCKIDDVDKITYSDCYQSTPLIMAVKKGFKHIVDFLLKEANANPNIVDSYGKTPLMYATENSPYIDDDHLTTMQKLIAYGADIEQVDQAGKTVLFYVTTLHGLFCVLETGINPNSKNKAGLTADEYIKKYSIFANCLDNLITYKKSYESKQHESQHIFISNLTTLLQRIIKGNLTNDPRGENIEKILASDQNLFTFVQYNPCIVQAFKKHIAEIYNPTLNLIERLKYNSFSNAIDHRLDEATSELTKLCLKYITYDKNNLLTSQQIARARFFQLLQPETQEKDSLETKDTIEHVVQS